MLTKQHCWIGLLLTCVSPSLAEMAIAQSVPLPIGKSNTAVSALQNEIELYCYKPAAFAGEKLILVLHGTNRNAEEYRDHAVGLADQFSGLLVAPKFDAERFPSIKYNRGGILHEDGSAAPPQDWTYHYIPIIVQSIREREQLPNLKLWVIGHSAGGQFIARMSAFLDIGAERLVAANPGSHLFPTTTAPFGYGFGGLPESLVGEKRLKQYLSAPLTIYVGTGDDHPDEYFDDSPEAMRQGSGRYQRGLTCFHFARQIAESNGWSFGWQLVEAEGVGHDHQAMFDHSNVAEALFGKDVAKLNDVRPSNTEANDNR